MDKKFSMNQQRVLVAKKVKGYPGVHLEQHSQQIEGGEPTLFLSLGEAMSGVLCPVLDSSVQERNGAPGTSPAEVYKDN